MAQPMEDIDSLTSFKTSYIDDGSTFDKKVPQLGEEEMDVVFLHESCDKKIDRQKNEQIQNNKLLGTQSFEKAFPWLVAFDKVMHSSIGKKSFHILESLLSIYVNNISKSLEANYIMTYEVIKLKKHLSNTLTFFHFYWHNINEHTSDRNTYLNKISVLLAIYIDTELRTSKCSKDPAKVTAKLFGALWIYLNKSEEHIFKALLRIKLITKRYGKICDPLFSKSFTNLKTNGEFMTGIKYVRYLLLLKLWRKIKEDTEGEKSVDELAVKILGSCVPKMHIDLLAFLPKIPVNCENETLWLMRSTLFDLKQACNDFVMLEEKIGMAECIELSSITKTIGMRDCNNLKINSNTMDDKKASTVNHTSNESKKINFNENGLFEDISKENNYFIKNNNREKVNKIKKSKFVPKMKSGEIIVIDFSKEDEECITSNKRKKNKCNKNLGWLRIVAKRCKAQKNIKYEQQIGIANVCNADNSVDVKYIQQCSDEKDNKNFKPIKNISFLKKEQSFNDTCYVNQKEECTVNKNCDHCVSLIRSKEKQISDMLHLLIALELVGKSAKDSASLLNILKEYKERNSSLQNITFDDKDSSITKLLSEISGNELIKLQLNEMQLQKDHDLAKNTDNYKNDDMKECKENYLLGTVMSDKDYNLQTTEITKQNSNVNSNCNTISVDSCNNSNHFNLSTIKETVPDTTYNNETYAKPIFDKGIVNILSDLESVMHVLGRISKHVMNVHIKKSDMECLNEKTGLCADSTTVIQDQATESLNHCISQNLNALNTPEIHQILKLCEKKNNTKNCNTLYSQDMCTSTQEGYDCGEYKCEKKTSTNLNKFVFNENQQSIRCKLLQSFDCDIKTEVEKTQGSCNNKKELDCLMEQLQKTDNYPPFTVNTKTQTETCTIDSRESEILANYDKNYLSLLNDYSQTAVEDNLIKIDSMIDYENVDILDSVLDTEVKRDFLDEVKSIAIKENTDTDIANKPNILVDTQSSLTSLIDQDSFYNVSNSTEHIVNPYSIKTSVEEKTLCINKPNNGINVEWYSQEMANITDTSVMKKSELYDKKKYSVGRCVDIVAFGLNAKKEEDFDLFALDDNGSISMLKNISSTRSSPLFIPSDVKISESTEFSPICISNDIKMEHVYDLQGIDILKEDESKTDAINQTLMNDGCTSRDIPSNALINYFPIQTEDRPASPYNCTSVYPLQLDLESLPAEQLIETPNLSLPFGQHDLTLCNSVSSDSQSIFPENDNIITSQFVHGLQSIEPYELIQQNVKMSSNNNQLYINQKETSQVSLSSHVSVDRERLSKVIEHSNTLWKQVELPDLNDTLPPKKRILMNFQGKPIPSIILKNGIENDRPIIMIAEGVSRDTNLLYKIESKGNILISTEKLCLKSSKGNVKSDTQISKVPAVKEKSLEEISTKISIRPNTRRLDIASFNGEASVKRRKVTPKLLPLLDTGRLMYSTNTQTQGKDLLSEIKDFSSPSNTSHTIV